VAAAKKIPFSIGAPLLPDLLLAGREERRLALRAHTTPPTGLGGAILRAASSAHSVRKWSQALSRTLSYARKIGRNGAAAARFQCERRSSRELNGILIWSLAQLRPHCQGKPVAWRWPSSAQTTTVQTQSQIHAMPSFRPHSLDGGVIFALDVEMILNWISDWRSSEEEAISDSSRPYAHALSALCVFAFAILRRRIPPLCPPRRPSEQGHQFPERGEPGAALLLILSPLKPHIIARGSLK